MSFKQFQMYFKFGFKGYESCILYLHLSVTVSVYFHIVLWKLQNGNFAYTKDIWNLVDR